MRIGLVLSGGLARGASQFGFLKAMVSRIDTSQIKVLSTASIGALNGVALSSDALDELEIVWRRFNCRNIPTLWSQITRGVFDDIFSQIIKDELKIPIYISTCRLPQLSAHYYHYHGKFNYEELRKITDTAITYPFINGVWKKIMKKHYIDGGLVDNIPVYPLMKYENDLDLILIVHCDPKYIPPQELIDGKRIVIDVDSTLYNEKISKTFSLSHDNIAEMLQSGYDYGMRFCDEVLDYMNDDSFVNRIHEFLIQEAQIRKKRCNFLTFVNIFNSFHTSRGFK